MLIIDLNGKFLWYKGELVAWKTITFYKIRPLKGLNRPNVNAN
jgi:hypothetical protein